MPSMILLNHMNKLKKGFTLIELLVVIAIIGILSTIVLSALSNSRAKAYDAKVKMQLSNFRGAAEMYFTSQNPTTYGPTTSLCSEYMFNNFNSQDGTPGLYIATGNLPSNTQVFCGSTDGVGSAYAVKATLYSGNDYWCVDSKGFSGLVSGTPSSGTSCP
jgi:prepilin-type N-terminal cleavage/methylation domain-containing protein